MKLSYNWLKEFVALELSAAELAAALPRLGFEAASIESRGPRFSGVVTGEIVEIGKHPNADRLAVCTVNDGANRLSIVCGAQNIAVGQKIPLARIGAKLPGGREITPAKIRGVESQGMICSSAELGLGAASNGGILVLDPSTAPGTDFASLAGAPDDILEVELTPNRPDCLSHFGLARELAALFKLPLKAPPAAAPAATGACALLIKVDDADACPRYIGRTLEGLKVGASPGWLSAKLEAIGLRPINAAVDITNYLMMDIGQPMHVFDLDKLKGELRVRAARKGEGLQALDGRRYDLQPGILVIADAERPHAIAGVMGGEESGVTENTTRILLESACFNPVTVRKSSQLLRLRTDSSYRFERGTDPSTPETASARAADLILKLCGPAAKCSSESVVGSHRVSISVTTSCPRINSILGTEFKDEEIADCLNRIGPVKRDGSNLSFAVPSHRGDISNPADLAEEVARLSGYERIPSRSPKLPLVAATLARSESVAQRARRRLSGYGLSEAYNYDFLSRKALESCRLSTEGLARLANPLSEDWEFLRPALLPGLLANTATNMNHGAAQIRIFEIGKTYARQPSSVKEVLGLAGVVFGSLADAGWKAARGAAADLHDLKGLLLDLLDGTPGFKLIALTETKESLTTDSLMSPATAWRITALGKPIGSAGLLHPTIQRKFEFTGDVCVFELNLDALAAIPTPKARYGAFGVLPPVKRDLSFIVDKSLPYAKIESAISSLKLAELSSCELIDSFAGKGIPEGKISYTMRLAFSSPDKTLTDADAANAVERIVQALAKSCGAALRA